MLYGSQACRKFGPKIVSFSLASYALFFFIFLCFLAFSHLSGAANKWWLSIRKSCLSFATWEASEVSNTMFEESSKMSH